MMRRETTERSLRDLNLRRLARRHSLQTLESTTIRRTVQIYF